MSGAELRLSMLLTAQGEQARRELQATGKAAADLRTAATGAGVQVTGLGEAGEAAAQGLGTMAAANDNLGRAAAEAASAIEGQGQAAEAAAQATDAARQSADLADAAYRRLASVAGMALGTIVGAVSIRAIAGMADTWSDLSARVGLAVGDMDRAGPVMDRLADIANRTYSSLTLTAEGFLLNSTSLTELGYRYEQQLDYLESVNNALVVSGARGERAARVSEALARGMALGELRGDGLNTVLQDGGRITQLLAERLGVTTNELRKLGADGAITGRIIYEALTGNLEKLRAEAESMPATIEDGFQRIQSNLLRLVGTMDQAVGASAGVASVLISVADNLDRIAVYAGLGAGVLALRYTPAIVAAAAGTTAATAAVNAFRLALARWPLGLALIGLGEIAYRLSQIERVAPGTGDAIDQAQQAQTLLNDALEEFNRDRSPTARTRLIEQATQTRDLAAAALAAAEAEILLMRAEAERFRNAPVEERGLLGDMVDDANQRELEAADAIVQSLSDGLATAQASLERAANTSLAPTISAGAEAATRLADEISRALGAMQSLSAQSMTALDDARIRNQHAGDPVATARGLAEARMRRAQEPIRADLGGNAGREIWRLDAEVSAEGERAAEIARLDADTAARTRGSRGGSSRATESQARGVDQLIASLQTELDLLRETDPVMQEMIRHREALAQAEEWERQAIEDLIRTRLDESMVLDQVQRQMEDVRELGHDVIRGIMQDLRDGALAGDILANVLDRIADKLLDLGASGFADILFGAKGSSDGGLLGGFIGGLLGGAKKNALGDVVGEPTMFAYADGRLGVMGEAGAEAIMPLTHAMGEGVGAVMGGVETTLPLTRLASGKLGVEVPQPFAMGGTFGHVPPPPIRPGREDFGRTHGGGTGAELIGTLRIGLEKGLTAQWQGEMRGLAMEIVDRGIDQYDRHLPDRMAQIGADPHLKG